MKQLIAPIAIIIALIAFFVIIDRKDFSRHDDVQTVQSDSPTTNRKSSVSVPETKPVTELRPAVETKPAETKPAAETRPAETKSVAEAKRAAETKSEAKPVAVPVARVEEAEELNAEAMAILSDIEKRKKDKTILEGQIVMISQCPDPDSIDYPDCNLSATVVLNDINHTEICLIIPCIRNSQKIISDTIQTNSLVAFKLIDEDSLLENEKSIQLADDNLNFELDYWYSDQVRTITQYSKTTRYRKKETKEIVYDNKLALTDKDVTTRKEYMDKETERLNDIISNFSAEDANVFCNNYSEYTKDIVKKHPYAAIEYGDGQKKIFPLYVRFSTESILNCSLSNDQSLITHNAQVIASINQFFKERGILLLVVTVPLPYESYAHLLGLSKRLSTYNINRISFMQQLLMLGVETLDLEPMIEENIMSPFHYFNILKHDLHPSEIGAYYFAQYIYNHLNRYEYFHTLIKNDYSIKADYIKEEVQYYGEHFSEMNSMSITDRTTSINKESPFLLVGDSFSEAGHFQYYLAHFLNTRVNVIRKSGSFPITAQLLQMRSSDISSNTKVCILFNSAQSLGQRFKPLFFTGFHQIYPSGSSPDVDLYMKSKDLLKETCSFDLVLPDTVDPQKQYRLLLYTYSNDNSVSYKIKVDTCQPQEFKGKESSIEFKLLELPDHLHISCSASSEKPIKDNVIMEITKIYLIEQ